LRIGHDRFLPGLRRLVEAVRAASGGETLLFIQTIDFLTIRRRPERTRFFERFLAVTDGHRDALARLQVGGADPRAGAGGAPVTAWRDAPEPEVRRVLAALPDERLPEVLTPRELEALALGYRERVTDLHLPHIRELPRVLPGLFADAA